MEYEPSLIEKRCRFVFDHKGTRVGITADPQVAADAEAEGMRIVQYLRSRGGITGVGDHARARKTFARNLRLTVL